MHGYAGNHIVSTLKIIPKEKYPFKIVGNEALSGKNISYQIEEAKTLKGMEYILKVENLKQEKGRYNDTISLKTNSKIRPLIKIRVTGYILEKDLKKQ